MKTASALRQRIAAVRRFNRFYTRQIGVLRRTYLGSPYSLAEMRVLYEIANGERLTASDVGRALDLDAGYLSRVLRNFEKQGLIARKTSAEDARQSHLALTAHGRKTFAPYEERSQQQARRDAGHAQARGPDAPGRGDGPRSARCSAPDATESKNRAAHHPARAQGRRLRLDRVAPHAELYLQEYGWGEPFEGLCAQIVADFVNKYDATCERLLDRRDGRREPPAASCW
ncbi:MAG: MarR family winged helix-turn-helix transcriptional regulator [Pseudolabrys sp.]